MKLFKKQEEKKGCSCAGKCGSSSKEKAQQKKTKGSRIKVLGTGCAKCMSLESNVKEALQELNIHEEIEHVTDFSEIASYGVISTPALVIDNNVVTLGKVLSKAEMLDLLEKIGF